MTAATNSKEELLRRGLERWREQRLADMENQIQEQNYIYGRAEFGLKCAHETPGVFDEDFIQDLWEDLNSSATELARLEKESDQLRAMDLPQLIIQFKQNRLNPVPPTALTESSPPTDIDRPAPPSEPEGETQETDAEQDYRSRAHDIVNAWREIMGMELEPDRVEEHLKSLEQWEKKWRKHGREENRD